MILKERDPLHHNDSGKFEKAGAEAEEQLAHYLRRAFLDHPDIWVFNDLRFEDVTDDVVQIDHLILHKHGLIVVESKSVTSEVKVNAQGEWVRIWNGRPQGMPSPVQQAKRQFQFLQRALDGNAEHMLGKFLGMQKRFGGFAWDVLVAISDRGIIDRHRESDCPEVCKADLIPEKIRARFNELHRKSSLLSMSLDPALSFTRDDMERIAKFLVDHHFPRTAEKPDRLSVPRKEAPENLAASVRPPLPEAERVPSSPILTLAEKCRKCAQPTSIEWGRYGYYWKCHACGLNLPIQEGCAKCKGKLFLRKEGAKYFGRCEACKSAEFLYFVAN